MSIALAFMGGENRKTAKTKSNKKLEKLFIIFSPFDCAQLLEIYTAIAMPSRRNIGKRQGSFLFNLINKGLDGSDDLDPNSCSGKPTSFASKVGKRLPTK
ncbi:MAG: hypothetical protein SWQ30_12920 [Thermodesulfobacteriota bacterium]|nr:hypothetical protein [Thermodesulfobacteriota bacterium]